MLHFISFFVFTMLFNVNLVYTHTEQSIVEENILANRSLDVKPRIMQGWMPDIGMYPWITYLSFRRINVSGFTSCGGSIITNRHVLTAGHCCRSEITILDSIRVRVSEQDLDMNPDCLWEIFHTNWFGYGCDSYIREYRAEETTEYMPYNPKTLTSPDLCVIKTTEEIVFGEYVQPINLPFGHGVDFRTMTFVGQELIAAGWGSVNEGMGNKGSFTLMDVELPVVDIQECKERWARYIPSSAKNFGYDKICAGSSAGRSICTGDSGGPLMYKHEGKTYLIGVASAAGYCVPFNPKDVPGLFVRVDYYEIWITTQIM